MEILLPFTHPAQVLFPHLSQVFALPYAVALPQLFLPLNTWIFLYTSPQRQSRELKPRARVTFAMSAMSCRMWQPECGLLPIPDHSGPPPIPQAAMHNEAKRLGIHSDVPPTGSQDHLNELLDGIHHLCDDIVLSGPDQLDSSSFHDAFEAMVSDCLKLLDPPDTIQDPESRKAFFTTVRKLVIHVMDVIKKHQHLQSRVRALAEINNGNINKITKHDDNLPRWSQFLGFNAPGAEKLQLEERGTCLQRQRRGYQVLPHAGIAILRNWDKEMTDMISAIDPDWEHGYWGPRFEWGSSSQHRLALGIRRFDALTVSPSPWAKFPRFENAEDMVHVNDERAEFEAIERLLGKSTREYLNTSG